MFWDDICRSLGYVRRIDSRSRRIEQKAEDDPSEAVFGVGRHPQARRGSDVISRPELHRHTPTICWLLH